MNELNITIPRQVCQMLTLLVRSLGREGREPHAMVSKLRARVEDTVAYLSINSDLSASAREDFNAYLAAMHSELKQYIVKRYNAAGLIQVVLGDVSSFRRSVANAKNEGYNQRKYGFYTVFQKIEYHCLPLSWDTSPGGNLMRGTAIREFSNFVRKCEWESLLLELGFCLTEAQSYARRLFALVTDGSSSAPRSDEVWSFKTNETSASRHEEVSADSIDTPSVADSNQAEVILLADSYYVTLTLGGTALTGNQNIAKLYYELTSEPELKTELANLHRNLFSSHTVPHGVESKAFAANLLETFHSDLIRLSARAAKLARKREAEKKRIEEQHVMAQLKKIDRKVLAKLKEDPAYMNNILNKLL